ncbi:MAG: acyltransferase [Nocardioides sp.]|uniref:acyltransferase family protein n=1 Tax=Nocardioides sp. TaxID=35761 RepID=UPI002607FF71|nr:acyltransferase [Nocardioides sp.]MCW2832612.1 acyltransferase [Nocardioides sp.]
MTPHHVDERPDFPGLDVLRAVGAIAVLTTHVAFQTGEYFRHGTLGVVLARLDVGVALFFVLSGFLLSRPFWARAVLERPAPRMRTYATKRFWRIFPIYVVAAGVALAFVPGNEDRGVPELLRSMTMLDTFVSRSLPYGLTQMWSLAVEVTFYVVLPLLMWFATGGGRGALRRSTPVLVGLPAISAVWILWVAPALADERAWSPTLWLPGFLSWFAAGLWLAREHVLQQAGRATGLGRRVAALGCQPGTCWVAASGLLLLTATPIAGPISLEPGTPAEALVKNVCYTAIGLLVVAAGAWSSPTGVYHRVASARILRHVGHVSYAIFCLHLIVLAGLLEMVDYDIFTGDFPRIWAMTLFGTLVVSEIAYWLVERPAIAFGRRSAVSIATQAATAEHAASTR